MKTMKMTKKKKKKKKKKKHIIPKTEINLVNWIIFT